MKINTLTFTQTKYGFETHTPIVYNNNSIHGTWFIRKTVSGKMWILEYLVDGYVYLPAQTVYGNENAAMQFATNSVMSSIHGENGKWYFTETNQKPIKFNVDRIPESNINWA